jgi:hypothetical protein
MEVKNFAIPGKHHEAIRSGWRMLFEIAERMAVTGRRYICDRRRIFVCVDGDPISM